MTKKTAPLEGIPFPSNQKTGAAQITATKTDNRSGIKIESAARIPATIITSQPNVANTGIPIPFFNVSVMCLQTSSPSGDGSQAIPMMIHSPLWVYIRQIMAYIGSTV
jgi:hypothetical protein